VIHLYIFVLFLWWPLSFKNRSFNVELIFFLLAKRQIVLIRELDLFALRYRTHIRFFPARDIAQGFV